MRNEICTSQYPPDYSNEQQEMSIFGRSYEFNSFRTRASSNARFNYVDNEHVQKGILRVGVEEYGLKLMCCHG